MIPVKTTITDVGDRSCYSSPMQCLCDVTCSKFLLHHLCSVYVTSHAVFLCDITCSVYVTSHEVVM